MKLRRITRKRATDEVYEALREAILTRGFKPGERLQVEEIAEKLGVSLTPVRHSVQRLCTEGLIEIRPRSGTFVATLTKDDIRRDGRVFGAAAKGGDERRDAAEARVGEQ